MERTKVTKEEPKVEESLESKPIVRPRWRKLGGGSLRIQINGVNKIIKPNEVFRAMPNEIPSAFRDTVMPLDEFHEATVAEIKKVEKSAKSAYKVVPRGKSKSMFDVLLMIGEDEGKRINDNPLPKAVAEQLKKELEG
jgi:predicted Zn-dependent protease with MMP-like domain